MKILILLMLFYSFSSLAVQVSSGSGSGTGTGTGPTGGGIDPNITLCPAIPTVKVTMTPKALVGGFGTPAEEISAWTLAGSPKTNEASGVVPCASKIITAKDGLRLNFLFACEYCLNNERVGIITKTGNKNCQAVNTDSVIGFKCNTLDVNRDKIATLDDSVKVTSDIDKIGLSGGAELTDAEMLVPIDKTKTGETAVVGTSDVSAIDSTKLSAATTEEMVLKETVLTKEQLILQIETLNKEQYLAKEQYALLEKQILVAKEGVERDTLVKQQILLKEQIATRELEIAKLQESLSKI